MRVSLKLLWFDLTKGLLLSLPCGYVWQLLVGLNMHWIFHIVLHPKRINSWKFINILLTNKYLSLSNEDGSRFNGLSYCCCCIAQRPLIYSDSCIWQVQGVKGYRLSESDWEYWDWDRRHCSPGIPSSFPGCTHGYVASPSPPHHSSTYRGLCSLTDVSILTKSRWNSLLDRLYWSVVHALQQLVTR